MHLDLALVLATSSFVTLNLQFLRSRESTCSFTGLLGFLNLDGSRSTVRTHFYAGVIQGAAVEAGTWGPKGGVQWALLEVSRAMCPEESTCCSFRV